MERLFFALWPDELTRQHLASVLQKLPENTGRKIPVENLHITLLFLGSVTESDRRCLVSGAGKLQCSPVVLNLNQSGWWRRAQVYWLAPGKIPLELQQLVTSLRALAGKCGIQTEDRPWKPHITLIRKASKKIVVPELNSIAWQVSTFALVRSDTRPEGARYEIIWNSSS